MQARGYAKAPERTVQVRECDARVVAAGRRHLVAAADMDGAEMQPAEVVSPNMSTEVMAAVEMGVRVTVGMAAMVAAVRAVATVAVAATVAATGLSRGSRQGGGSEGRDRDQREQGRSTVALA